MIRKKIVGLGIVIMGLIIAFGSTSTSCRKKDEINTSSSFKLKFSTDTVSFDTIFTTVGSVTRWLTVYNTSDKEVVISNIGVAGGMNSWFKMNVDGLSGNEQFDVEIPANDSIRIFTKITIDPNDESTPFIVEDAINFHVNGNEQKVRLEAWGQNANYIVADQFIRQGTRKLKYKIVAKAGETVHWTNEKPYLIYGGYATIDSDAKLIIEEGTQVYCYTNAGIWSYWDGSLEINGTKENPVVIQGHRLSGSNKEKAGQWDRIWILDGNQDSKINYAIIKEGKFGVQAEYIPRTGNGYMISQNKLDITNTIIENNVGTNMILRSFQVNANNLISGAAGQGGIVIEGGGNYDFRQTTVYNEFGSIYKGSGSRNNNPSFYVNNFIGDLDDANHLQMPLTFLNGNSIISGSARDELNIVLSDKEDNIPTIGFLNCYIRSNEFKPENYPNVFTDCIFDKNNNPGLVGKTDQSMNGKGEDYYNPTEDGQIRNKGNEAIGASVPLDLRGNNRAVPKPDLGALEYVAE